MEAGTHGAGSSYFLLPNGARDSVPGRGMIFPVWSELRSSMYEADKGTWFSARLTLKSDGSFAFEFNYDRRPYVGNPATTFEPSRFGPRPLDEEWLVDLERYPRSPEFMPTWLSEIVVAASAPRPASWGKAIEKAIDAPVSWPSEYEVLAPKWGWRDIFASVSEHMVRRLRSDADYVAVLSDEGKRDQWSGQLEGLFADVFADVFDEVLLGRPMDVLIRLWQFYSANLRVPNRPAIDDLDPSAPIGRGELPGVAGSLIDDVQDVVSSIIEKQIVDRFGIRAD
ncbi:hypothetical protein [Frondihabitans peucedani]|uniref:Uncharacterized protein n=1 Tax=Frondihabitans peucedani TaxID=598626 RepID=A0ABP8DWU6_9MICO